MKQISLQHNVLGYFFYLYFPKHKLAIEIDEKGHTENKEQKRENKIKECLAYKFIRTNSDTGNSAIFIEIGKTHNHIIEPNKKLTKTSTKKFLIVKISKRLLALELKPNHSVKSKCLKFILKKNYCHQYETCKLAV